MLEEIKFSFITVDDFRKYLLINKSVSNKNSILINILLTHVGAVRGMKPMKAGNTGIIPISVIR